jgi:hypothetical protein
MKAHFNAVSNGQVVRGETSYVSVTVAHGPGTTVTGEFRAYDRNGTNIAEIDVPFGPEGMGKTYSLRARGIWSVMMWIPAQGMIDDLCFGPVTPPPCTNCIDFDRLPDNTPVAAYTKITNQYQASPTRPSGVVFEDKGLVTSFFPVCENQTFPNSAWGDNEKDTVMRASFYSYGRNGTIPGATDCVSVMVIHYTTLGQGVMLKGYDATGNLVGEAPVDFTPEGMCHSFSLQAPGIHSVALPLSGGATIDDFCYGPVAPASGQPDLVVGDLFVLPLSIKPGGTATVTFSIVNEGDAVAEPATHQVHLLANQWDPHGQYPVPADVTLATVSTGKLEPKAAQRFIESVAIPQNMAPGLGVIIVMVDVDSVVKESNEKNNTKQVFITIAQPFGD